MVGREVCTGCAACAQRCPKGCISMEPDDYGFLYPGVDSTQCIDCGLCSKVCPVLQELPQAADTPACYAANARDSEIRARSSSGGVFSVLALHVLDRGGVVFGAAMGEHQRVSHIGIEIREELHSLQGSKYVQSEVGGAYIQAEKYLKAGRWVLFTGTSCQIGGLRAYLGRDYDKLYTLDVICHGVPATKVWERYKAEQERQHHAKITGVSFRDKEVGWKQFSMALQFDNADTYRRVHRDDSFFRIFLHDICLRPSCYQCVYKGKAPAADLTLGDAWKIEKFAKELDDDLGTSVVFLHTEKAKVLFAEIKPELEWREIPAEAAMRGNPAYLAPPRPHEHRRRFLKQLKNGAGMEKLVQLSELSWDVRLRRILRNTVGKLLQK